MKCHSNYLGSGQCRESWLWPESQLPDYTEMDASNCCHFEGSLGTGWWDAWKNSRERSWRHVKELDLLSRSVGIHVHGFSATARKEKLLLWICLWGHSPNALLALPPQFELISSDICKSKHIDLAEMTAISVLGFHLYTSLLRTEDCTIFDGMLSVWEALTNVNDTHNLKSRVWSAQ